MRDTIKGGRDAIKERKGGGKKGDAIKEGRHAIKERKGGKEMQ